MASINPTRPDILLRLEAALLLTISCGAYQHLFPGHWLLFAAFFLAPDISLFAFILPSKQAASVIYNLLHTELCPLILGLIAWRQSSSLLGEIALIWLTHIAFDRLLGYGLKLPSNFKLTHIQTAAEQTNV